ncbi:MAG: endonuclease/exonuclease/phosphatase [Parcubacteria group bacterium LiPW_30]|nr:MAG: endonuclease/exonuclease/phosphatase [Parcubacteria group bacterium LiPW_30]
MADSISLVSLNIELDQHFERIFPFFEKVNPDVLCVQELREEDIPLFEKNIGVKCFYVPMAHQVYRGVSETFGVGIFSKLPVLSTGVKNYYGNAEKVPDYINPDQNTVSRVLLYCDVVKNNSTFRVGTTHFTWTFGGVPDDLQRRDLKGFLLALEEAGEIVFTGDFNAPRGGEIFGELAKRFKDNVPQKYTTSIDVAFHKNPNIKNLMVDGIFSTKSYSVEGVEMICGLSDHCALVAKVSKV